MKTETKTLCCLAQLRVRWQIGWFVIGRSNGSMLGWESPSPHCEWNLERVLIQFSAQIIHLIPKREFSHYRTQIGSSISDHGKEFSFQSYLIVALIIFPSLVYGYCKPVSLHSWNFWLLTFRLLLLLWYNKTVITFLLP